MPEQTTAESTIPAIEQMVLNFDQDTLPKDTAVYLVGIGLDGKTTIGFVVGKGTDKTEVTRLGDAFRDACKSLKV